MDYMRLFFKLLIRSVLRIISVFFPIKKRICFEAYEGRQIACNPYYIYQLLVSKYSDLEYIWIYNKKQKRNLTCIRRNTWRYVCTLMSSSVYITNDDIPIYIPFRRSQMVINTWHGGGAYKRVGMALCPNFSTRVYYKLFNRSISWFISSSKVFTDIISDSFLVEKQKFLPFGQPRNDIFFNQKDIDYSNKRIRSLYSIQEHSVVVLYAPTYRSINNPILDSEMELHKIADIVNKKFGRNPVFLVRNHHGLSTVNFDQSDIAVCDVSHHPSMQELLCAADILISDYSSCIWDFSFLYRPCFLFAQDLLDYQERQNFYKPIESWGFPIAVTSEELVKAIAEFDIDDFKQRMIQHHSDLISYEKGNATESVCQLIMSHFCKS